MLCPHCRKQVGDGDAFCAHCGHRLANPLVMIPPTPEAAPTVSTGMNSASIVALIALTCLVVGAIVTNASDRSSSALGLGVVLIVIAIVLGLVALFSPGPPPPPKYCADCGHIGASRVYDSGNDVTQILLVLLFVIPGVFYALWRRSMRYGGCRLCKSRRVMPLETPVAQEALRKMRAASSPASTDLSR